MQDIVHFKPFKNYIGELSVTFRRTELPSITVNSSSSAVETLHKAFDECMDNHEEFKVLHLNNANGVVNIHTVASGTESGVLVSIKSIMRNALLSSCSSILISHNHPSGRLVPSQADKHLTEKLKKACEVMDLKLLDHIIVTRESYYSFADEGIL